MLPHPSAIDKVKYYWKEAKNDKWRVGANIKGKEIFST
jgi:hypothetical protein